MPEPPNTSYFVERAHLSSDDYEAFLVARRDALLAQAADVMGKGLVAVPEEAGEPVKDEEFEDDPDPSGKVNVPGADGQRNRPLVVVYAPPDERSARDRCHGATVR